MSTEEDKIKRTKRMQKDECAVAKQVKIAKEKGVKVDEAHKFAKRHAMDCGTANCYLCGNARQFHGATVQEKSFAQTTKWDGE